MSHLRDPDLIIATWLDDGPVTLPDETRRAIAVGLRTQGRVRRLAILGWSMFPLSRFVAAAAIVLAVSGLAIVVQSNRTGGAGSVTSPTPLASPTATVSPSVPAMTRTFISRKHGYSVRYPAGWATTVATSVGPWSPITHPQPADDQYDYIDGGGGFFRAASAVLPAGARVDDWIGQYLTDSDIPACTPPRISLEPVTIDGQAGRLRGFCGDAKEIEVTVVVGDRVYLFTLFRGSKITTEAEERALFDAMLATIALDPADAEVALTASPS